MEGSEKRIEERIKQAFGLAEAIREQREKPVWQRPSFSAPTDHHMVNPRHYSKHAIEPWDYVAANKLGYFEGSAIKYVTRWRDKNGLTDLRKAIRFIEKLIEVEEKRLVGQAGEQVGGQPASEHAKDGADRRDGSE